MPVYAWKGLNNAGKAMSGNKDADGPKGLRLALRKEGVYVTEHKEVLGGGGAKATLASGEKVPFFKREIDLGGLLERVRPQDVAVLTRQLATLLKAGIPLAEALGALGEQEDNKKLAMVLVEVREKVNQGTSFAETLAAHDRIFPELYVNMVRSGESAGNLDAVLMRLADFLDAQNALRSKVSSALVYPIIMMVLGAAVMSMLMIFVVPKITSVFEDLNKTLPWNTELLIFVSHFIGSYWWALIVLFILVYVGIKRWARKPSGRAVVDRLKLKLWLIGP